jgi:hypothetical protein
MVARLGCAAVAICLDRKRGFRLGVDPTVDRSLLRLSGDVSRAKLGWGGRFSIYDWVLGVFFPPLVATDRGGWISFLSGLHSSHGSKYALGHCARAFYASTFYVSDSILASDRDFRGVMRVARDCCPAARRDENGTLQILRL